MASSNKCRLGSQQASTLAAFGAGDIVSGSPPTGIVSTVAILGIARSGAAWLLLGQSQGLVRVKAMIEDAEPTLVINVGISSMGSSSCLWKR